MGNTALPLSTEVLGLTGQTKVRLGTSVGKTCSDIQGKGQESTRKAPTLSRLSPLNTHLPRPSARASSLARRRKPFVLYQQPQVTRHGPYQGKLTIFYQLVAVNNVLTVVVQQTARKSTGGSLSAILPSTPTVQCLTSHSYFRKGSS